MKVGPYACPRRDAVLFLIFLLVICAVAEEGVLVLSVMDMRKHPFSGVRIGIEGGGGSPQTTDQNGKARLALASGTKPNTPVELQIENQPNGIDVSIISPFEGQTTVPPFDNEQTNYRRVVLVKSGDLDMLQSADGSLALHAAAAKSASAQKKPPASQYYRHRPPTVAFNPPHLQTVALRESISPLDHADPQCPDDEIQKAALAAAAQKFGLPVKDVKDALAVWGGDDVVWGEIMLTASIEAAGYPFSSARTANQDIQFGSGIWSLRECSLQPVLLQFQQRDQKRFAEIIGADTEWLSKTMSGPCEASANAALQRMLDNSGQVSGLWRSRFQELGDEPSFQHVQVEQVQLDVTKARTLAAALGLQSDRAVAFLAAPAIRSLVSATPTFRERYLQDVASFTRQNGRAPDEQEKLLILKNKTIESWQGQLGTSPEARSNFVSLVDLLSAGTGMVSGRHYDLDEFGIRLRSAEACRESKSTPPTIGGACAGAGFDAAGEKQLVDLMNQERTKQGIPPLQADPRLTQAARKHTALMVQSHSKTHQIGSEPPMAARLSNENLPSDQQAENISVAPTVAENHDRMMHSTDHRTNILNPDYNVIGVGAVQCGGGLWVTQDFAHRLPEYSESQADAALEAAINQYAKAQGMRPPTRKPQTDLRSMACEMARKGAVDREAPAQLPGVQGAVVWRTGDPAELPAHAQARLSQPMPSGYSLGACFAPSVDHPGGIYWVVMVTY
jgi:uncharacterized protein YkwD